MKLTQSGTFIAYRTICTICTVFTFGLIQPAVAQAPNAPAGRVDLLHSDIDTPPQARSLLFQPPIRHIGVVVKGSPLKTGGSDAFVPALRQIVPEGWAAWEGRDLSVPLPQALKWAGGKVWFDALGDALLREGLRADVDWGRRALVIHSQRSERGDRASRLSSAAGVTTTIPSTSSATPATAAPMPSSLAMATAPSLPMTASMPAMVPSAAVTAPSLTEVDISRDTPRRWQLSSDQNFRETLTEWAVRASWKMRYTGQNYRPDFPLEIEADFEDAICAAIEGINEGRPKDKPPLDAAFWPANRALRVFEEKPDVLIAGPNGSCRRPHSPVSMQSAQAGTQAKGVHLP